MPPDTPALVSLPLPSSNVVEQLLSQFMGAHADSPAHGGSFKFSITRCDTFHFFSLLMFCLNTEMFGRLWEMGESGRRM